MKIDIKAFLESDKSVDDFLEDVTTTSMPGARALPIHAHEFKNEEERPANPADDSAVEAATEEGKEGEVSGAGPIKVPETKAGEDYEPKQDGPPKPNMPTKEVKGPGTDNLITSPSK